jgi:hypothetical protein
MSRPRPCTGPVDVSKPIPPYAVPPRPQKGVRLPGPSARGGAVAGSGAAGDHARSDGGVHRRARCGHGTPACDRRRRRSSAVRYLARIEAYDDAGPAINAVLTVNERRARRGGGARRGAAADRPALATARYPGRPEGQHRHGGPADHGGVLPARRRAAAGRRLPDAAAARRRCHRPRQGESLRVRLRRPPQFPRWTDLQSARHDAFAVRLVRRDRCGRGRRLRAARVSVRTRAAPCAGRPRRTASSA